MAKNPEFFSRGKVVGDLVANPKCVISAVVADANAGDPVELGTALVVEAGENTGYTATKAQLNDANAILLETTDDAQREVAILVSGELKESFYAESPLSKELRTSLLKAGITLR